MNDPYCGADAPPLSPAWVDGGYSPCFLSTTTSLLSMAWVLLTGAAAICLPEKKAKKKDNATQEPRGRDNAPASAEAVRKIRSALSITIALSHLANIGLVAADDGAVEYVIVMNVLAATAWAMSTSLLKQVRKTGKLNVPLVGFWLIASVRIVLELASAGSPHFFFRNIGTGYNPGYLAVFSVRVACVLLLLLSPALRRQRRVTRGGFGLAVNVEDGEEETTSLLGNAEEGSAPQTKPAEGSIAARSGSAWGGLSKKLSIIWPFVWPKNQPLLQLNVLFCVVLLVLGRVVNLFTPIFYKKIVDVLTPAAGVGAGNGTVTQLPAFGLTGIPVPFPADYILVYVGLRFLQGGGAGGMGILNNLRQFLWISMQNYSARESKVQVFQHLHNLSLRWHLSRKTGEVLRIVDRGTGSVNSLLSYIIFNIAPTLVDIGIAVGYFTVKFGSYLGLIVFLTMGLYIYATIALTEWRTKFRRAMNQQDNKMRQTAVDSLLNFETVKYYNGEAYETKRYDSQMVGLLNATWTSMATLNLLNSVQNIIIIVGLLAGSLLCGKMVSAGDLTVGDFVLFISYIVQLYAPLNFFGTYFRMIQSNLIDMENMFDLLDVEPEMVDAPDARDLVLDEKTNGCSVEFDHVSFGYSPRKQILHDVSFKIGAGETLAIVGTTGSGKSTIMRLLFRFYDLQSGAIRVNGQDVSKLTQTSLRRAMGVVPQDTVLFNDHIKYNIKYGDVNASDEKVIEAANAAEIHDAIERFPDGYDTVVGERGLKLSGGEKQRIAIARTILKAPQIILLDEATSALDTETERSIQASLNRVCANRTTIAIAHRLSTVVNADVILVLKEGRVVEQGRHAELLASEGHYFEMWNRQLEASEVEDTPSQDSAVAATAK